MCGSYLTILHAFLSQARANTGGDQMGSCVDDPALASTRPRDNDPTLVVAPDDVHSCR